LRDVSEWLGAIAVAFVEVEGPEEDDGKDLVLAEAG